MKFVKTLLALAVVGAAVSAQAESDLKSTLVPATGLSAVAHLNFRINVPKILYLRVGSGTDFTPSTTVDEVLFDVGVAAVLTPGAALAATSGGTVGARVFGNGGDVSLIAGGSGTGLVNAAGDVIPWSQIARTSSTTFANPTIDSSSTTLAGRIVNQSANWTFQYSNTSSVPNGSYTGQVTYTASLP